MELKSSIDGLSAHQVRRARHLLGWSLPHLAIVSGTSEYVVGRFEQEGRAPQGYPLDQVSDPVAAIRRAFVAAGVDFSGGDASK